MSLVYLVGLMQTYLGDTMKSTTLSSDLYIANAALNLKLLKERKFTLSQIPQ